jgi:nitroimidazol reductase NimA-like FMN-containing flavoprotein (pyridoxamine 5'-phosphate oxidase superfamily)
MRRRDREISTREEIDAVIHQATVCHLAFAAGDEPYLVPISFGYDGEALYIHTAKTGMKIDFIERNNRVCFELEANVVLQADQTDACKWAFTFESVIGWGTVTELTTPEAKAHGLNRIMEHYSGREWEMGDAALSTTRVWRIGIEEITGKRSAEKPANSSSEPATSTGSTQSTVSKSQSA